MDYYKEHAQDSIVCYTDGSMICYGMAIWIVIRNMHKIV